MPDIKFRNYILVIIIKWNLDIDFTKHKIKKIECFTNLFKIKIKIGKTWCVHKTTLTKQMVSNLLGSKCGKFLYK